MWFPILIENLLLLLLSKGIWASLQVILALYNNFLVQNATVKAPKSYF